MDKNYRTVLATDTREQAPLKFRAGLFDEYVVEGLPFGDYALFLRYEDGTEKMVPIVFERKGSMSDLFSTMGKNYQRFKREMKRAEENGFKLVLIIEGSMEEVFRGCEHSQMTGETMLKKLAMLYVRYDLEYVFCNSARELSRRIEDCYQAVVRNYGVESPLKSAD